VGNEATQVGGVGWATWLEQVARLYMLLNINYISCVK